LLIGFIKNKQTSYTVLHFLTILLHKNLEGTIKQNCRMLEKKANWTM